MCGALHHIGLMSTTSAHPHVAAGSPTRGRPATGMLLHNVIIQLLHIQPGTGRLRMELNHDHVGSTTINCSAIQCVELLHGLGWAHNYRVDCDDVRASVVCFIWVQSESLRSIIATVAHLAGQLRNELQARPGVCGFFTSLLSPSVAAHSSNSQNQKKPAINIATVAALHKSLHNLWCWRVL